MTQPIFDFTDSIAERTQDFTGREWVFAEIDRWLATPDAPRYFIITGEPGIGKTAIAARLTQIRNFAAVHFCIARQAETIDPLNSARSISHQLTRIEGFAQSILNEKHVQIDVRISNVREVRGNVIGVSGSDDHTLKVWNLQTGTCQQTLTGHTRAVTAVAVTPDGTRAVSGAEDKTLKVWDLQTGLCQQTLIGHIGLVLAVAMTPDGTRVVSGSQDTTLKVWDLNSGQVLMTFWADAPVQACAVAPDGRTIVAGDSLGNVHFLRVVEEGNDRNDR